MLDFNFMALTNQLRFLVWGYDTHVPYAVCEIFFVSQRLQKWRLLETLSLYPANLT
jgi:hypothetical protein